MDRRRAYMLKKSAQRRTAQKGIRFGIGEVKKKSTIESEKTGDRVREGGAGQGDVKENRDRAKGVGEQFEIMNTPGGLIGGLLGPC